MAAVLQQRVSQPEISKVDSSGVPLTAKQLEEQAYFTAIVERRRPTLKLKREHRVTKKNNHPPQLLYGFELTRAQIFAYAQSHELKPLDPTLGPLTESICLFPSLQRLRDLTGETYLGFCPAFPPSPETFVVTLYSNYTIDVLQCGDDDEKEILNILREEFCIDEKVQPMWYWYGGTEWD